MTKKIFTACLGTETNSFSPIPTGMDLYRRTMLVRGGAHGEKPNVFALPLIVWKRRAQALGWQVVEGLAAFAMPAGDTTRSAYEALRDEILADLRAALPVDGVMINLHGAMIADGYPDAEGDLLAHVRRIVGPAVPVGAELDLHCHLTELKVASVDAMVIFKEYPHVDVTDRAEELFTIMEKHLTGRARPVMAMHDCRMIGIYPTTREPLRGFVDRMTALEGKDGILSVSLGHGFPWGDTPEVGTRVLVVADGDGPKAQALADRLGREIWAMREAIMPPFKTIDDVVGRVAGHNGEKPLVLADTADNPGIGAAGDSTFMLRRFIERKVGGVAIAPFWDPQATLSAFEGGIGARLRLRIGGKLGPASGDPVDATVTVKGLVRDAYQPFGKAMTPMGNMAWVRIGETDAEAIDIVVNDYRTQAFAPECFTAAGLDVARCRGLIVKSTQHFHAGFLPVADDILYVSAPGTGSMDMRQLPYTRVARQVWPRVADPHGA
ncbi:MAG: M81 family metallopeptidase [Alphaproteobacteria bacterium]|nr:M81 family metallopeptidase [Alphaproteobacteria bacterium]